MIFQTLTMPGGETSETPADLPIDGRQAMTEPGWPKMAFIEHRLAEEAEMRAATGRPDMNAGATRKREPS